MLTSIFFLVEAEDNDSDAETCLTDNVALQSRTEKAEKTETTSADETTQGNSLTT